MEREEFLRRKRQIEGKHQDSLDDKIADIVLQLIEARISQKKTQGEISELSEIATNTISRIENGLQKPSLRVLLKMCKALDMELKLEKIE